MRRSPGSIWEEVIKPNIEIIGASLRRGATQDEIADMLGINVSSLQDWIRKKPELKDVFRVDKDKAVLAVENALWKKAIGYVSIDEWEEEEQQPDGTVKVVKKKTRKKFEPDRTAILAYLFNRAPDRWAYKPVATEEEQDQLEVLSNSLMDVAKAISSKGASKGDGEEK